MKERKIGHSHIDRKIAEAVLPLLILPLVRKGVIAEKHLDDPRALAVLLSKNLRFAVKKMRWCPAIDDDFLTQSVQLWRGGQRSVAVVLYATAAEQIINQMFQLILIAQGWKSGHAASLLRAVNLPGKLGWMFEALTKHTFPRPLGKRLRLVSEIRNAIVHFKGEPGHPDTGEDSFSKVQAAVRSLGRMSISRDARLLSEACHSALMRVDPDSELALRAAEKIRQLKDARGVGEHSRRR